MSNKSSHRFIVSVEAEDRLEAKQLLLDLLSVQEYPSIGVMNDPSIGLHDLAMDISDLVQRHGFRKEPT